jgi:hypothetical protein
VWLFYKGRIVKSLLLLLLLLLLLSPCRVLTDSLHLHRTSWCLSGLRLVATNFDWTESRLFVPSFAVQLLNPNVVFALQLMKDGQALFGFLSFKLFCKYLSSCIA